MHRVRVCRGGPSRRRPRVLAAGRFRARGGRSRTRSPGAALTDSRVRWATMAALGVPYLSCAQPLRRALQLQPRLPGRRLEWPRQSSHPQDLPHACGGGHGAPRRRSPSTGARCARPRRSAARASETWIAGAREGTIRNRSGDRYKPASSEATRPRSAAHPAGPRTGGCRTSGAPTSRTWPTASSPEGSIPAASKRPHAASGHLPAGGRPREIAVNPCTTVFSSPPYGVAGSGSLRPRRPRASSPAWPIGIVPLGDGALRWPPPR